MTTETDEVEYQDMDTDENLELPYKHHLLPIAQEESKRMKSTPFSDLNEDQLTDIFGEGLRLQLGQAYVVHETLSRDLNLFGTIQVTPDFSPDPLLQNAVFDVFNREFNHPIRASSFGHGQLLELIHTSFPVSSTSVVQIAAKLYVTTDKLDDVEIYIDDHDRVPTVVEAVFSIPRPHIDIMDEETRDRLLEQAFGCTNRRVQNELLPTLLPREPDPEPESESEPESEPEPEHENEAFHICDDHTFINISDMLKCRGRGRLVKFEGKDGHIEMTYGVFKYAVDAHLELVLVPTSTLKNVTGSVLVYYPAHKLEIELYDYRTSTSFITPGKMNLIRSVLAVPANSSFIITAHLREYMGGEILSGDHEFHVPRDRPSSDETIEGDKCYLNLKVNWKLPSEEQKIPSSSNLSVSHLTERRKSGAHSTPTMADPDECNRWSLQEEIAKVFDTSLKRTLNPQEAVPCSISTCTKEDGGDYLCSSVMNIWPEIRNACVYKGPKHAGVAVKNDIVNSDYKDMMERCVVCGPGFVKFKLCRKWIAKCIHTMLTVGIETWAPKLSVKKVVIYYGSTVTYGDGSMSFFRSTNIGETLARVLEYSGVVVRRKRISHPHEVMRSWYSMLDQRLGVDAEVEEESYPYNKKIHNLPLEKGLHVERGGDGNALTNALTEEKADWILGVADVRERVHIESCITAAKRAGLIANDRSRFLLSHVGFGLFHGEKLTLVNLLHLLEETKNCCMLFLARRGNYGEWTHRDLEHAAEALGYGAVQYADLKNNRLTDYTFSLDQMLNEEGNTAVYLQFTYVRMCSILTSSSEDIKGLTAEVLLLKHDNERELGLHLLQFTEVLGEVCTILTPHIMCDYLYGLCKKFNSLDSSVWQDVEVGSGEETSKLLLCKASEVVMRKCFYLLGITPIR